MVSSLQSSAPDTILPLEGDQSRHKMIPSCARHCRGLELGTRDLIVRRLSPL